MTPADTPPTEPRPADTSTRESDIRRRGRKLRTQRRRNLYWGLLFTSPGIIGLLVFQAYPILASLYLSLTSATMQRPPRWTGLANFRGLLQDERWWKSLGVTAQYILLAIPLGIVVALAIALLLNQNVRGQRFYRVIFYLPAVVPLVASAVVWTYVFDPQYGVVNQSLSAVGLTGPGWLNDIGKPLGPLGPTWALIAVILFTTWGVGNLMIILLAGLQDVPTDLKDQAMVDGAGAVSRFRHVTVPFLSPHLLFALVTGLIAGFQFFTPVYVLADGTGGQNNSLLLSSIYLYQNAFQFFKVGYASAMAWVLFVIVALVTAMVFRFVGRRVYYGGA